MKASLLSATILLGLAACTHHSSMRKQLEYVSSCNRSDTLFTEKWLPKVDSLAGYFSEHGSPNERLMAHYLKGRVLSDMGETPHALECSQQAINESI